MEQESLAENLASVGSSRCQQPTWSKVADRALRFPSSLRDGRNERQHPKGLLEACDAGYAAIAEFPR